MRSWSIHSLYASMLMGSLAVAGGVATGQADPSPTSRPEVPAEHLMPVDPPADGRQPLIQVALLLDTSNSMDGLINQARTQLWRLVNQFNRVQHDGKTPRIEAALYEYGNDNLSVGEGYIRLVQAFTTDLDVVSEKLWALQTKGGSEFCGHVIRSAARELSWSRQPNAYRAIFIAGNEPFTQGEVDYKFAIGEAVGRGVIVNTIHCGSEQDGRGGEWDQGARLGNGRYLVIDQDRVVRVPACPQDARLRELSSLLNTTYVPIGQAGVAARTRQAKQDEIVASAAPAAAAERAKVKGSSAYDNRRWDAVDQLKAGELQLEAIAESELPPEMQDMDDAQRESYVKQQLEKREAIQQEIDRLSAEREKHLRKLQEQQDDGTSLDDAILAAVNEQLKDLNFKSK